MSIDLAKLKRLTSEAIARGKEAAERLEAERIAKEERQRRKDRDYADRVIARIPAKAESAAEEGHSYAVVMVVMAVKYEDYTRSHDETNYNKCSPAWLKAHMFILQDLCEMEFRAGRWYRPTWSRGKTTEEIFE